MKRMLCHHALQTHLILLSFAQRGKIIAQKTLRSERTSKDGYTRQHFMVVFRACDIALKSFGVDPPIESDTQKSLWSISLIDELGEDAAKEVVVYLTIR